MNFLNLSKGFNPFGAAESNIINFEAFTFSGGEPHIKLIPTLEQLTDVDWVVTCRVNSFNDMGMVMAAKNAIDNTYVENVTLFIPYFPGARQDRIMVAGEPFTAKMYADLINHLGFDSVVIMDAHSDVAPALINSCVNRNNHKFVGYCLQHIKNNREMDKETVLISPDAGAQKKIYKLIEALHDDYPLIKCDKTRDVSTGRLSGFEVYADDLKGADCVIVDDICDGGGTFLGLADELKKKNSGDLYLLVTHGIFSKGFDNLLTRFQGIYFTDSIKNLHDESTPENLVQVEISKLT